MIRSKENFTSTRNACKLCTPLGACLAFRGIRGCVPLLHGSQGCATYVRRYMISHFKEPVDIASSSFGESTAIFGGGENFRQAVRNVIDGYHPEVIGVATTCLSETIGDDMPMFIREILRNHEGRDLPCIIHASTPSYRGTHADGFLEAVRATIDALAEPGQTGKHINLLPGMVSPEDLRHLREICEDFGLDAVILPDYSDTLDGPVWEDYHRIPEGGTGLDDVRRMGRAAATIEFNLTAPDKATGGALLAQRFGVPHHRLALPIGIRQCDAFFDLLARLSGRDLPDKYRRRRGRLVDSYVDGHKYVSANRAVVYGIQEEVVAVAGMLSEIGITPALCSSGGKSGQMASCLERLAPERFEAIKVMEGADFVEIETEAQQIGADLLIGNSKGFKASRRLEIPLVRIGFPVHDRFGSARVLHVGYRGTQGLFDRIVNAEMEKRQKASPVGYTYM